VESTTVLAGLVERILARLQFKVKDVRVRILYEDKSDGAVYELRIGEVRFADESDASDDLSAKQTIRAVRLSSISVFMLPLPPPSSSPARPRFYSTSTRSSSSESITSSTIDDQAEMYMSQAVADLRQSATSTLSSGASVYQSALTERVIDEEPVEEGTPLPEDGWSSTHRNRSRSESRNRSATPTGHPRRQHGVLLLSFGSEDVVLHLKTTRPTQAKPADCVVAAADGTGATPAQTQTASTTSNASTLPAVHVDLSLGTITGLIVPEQASSILSALQAVAPPTSDKSTIDPTAVDPLTVVQPCLEAKIRIKSVFVVLVYDMKAHESDDLGEAAAQFWQKPSSTYLPFGHLKLRLEGLEGGYSSKGYVPRTPQVLRRGTLLTSGIARRPSSAAHFGPRPPVFSLSLSDASVSEYLASDSASTERAQDDAPPRGEFPVLIFDTNLLKQYDVPPGAHSIPSGVPRASKTVPLTFPEFETVDWRNPGLQKKAGAGEKAWKVRSRGRGVLKGAPNFGGGVDEGPAVTVRKEAGAASRKSVDGNLMRVSR
jgi:autophagy-related protein 2